MHDDKTAYKLLRLTFLVNSYVHVLKGVALLMAVDDTDKVTNTVLLLTPPPSRSFLLRTV